MCWLEWLGSLKCRATGLYVSLSFLSTSHRCSWKRSPSLTGHLISETSIAFLDIKVSINGKGFYLPVWTTNPHFPTVICCIHPLILLSQFLRLRRLCSDDFNFPTNQRKCAISSRNVAILIDLSTRFNTVLNRLIDTQHCKRDRRKRTREFHLHWLTIHITSLRHFKEL